MSTRYDRSAARQALADFRLSRRSATPGAVAEVCRALGYRIDRGRGKGSHWLAVRPGGACDHDPDREQGARVEDGNRDP